MKKLKRLGNASLGLVSLLASGYVGCTAYEIAHSMAEYAPEMFNDAERFTEKVMTSGFIGLSGGIVLLGVGAAGYFAYVGGKKLYQAVRPKE